MATQISCAIEECDELVNKLHRDELDRGCIVTFSDYMKVRQEMIFCLKSRIIYCFCMIFFNTFFLTNLYKNFTEYKGSLHSSLNGLYDVADGDTRLYDSIVDIIQIFHSSGVNSRPYILVVVTDGVDNISSRSSRKCAQEISNLFTNNPTNHLFLVGVGDRVDSERWKRYCHTFCL
jgi:hypothetical protein